jgi:NADP-dependent 3-hydroxy acid dehydrogenase YdfG
MGQASARLLAASGFKVILAARRAQMLEQIVSEIGSRATAVATDVSKQQEVERLVARTESSEKRIDQLFYFAGTNIPERSIDILTAENWEMMLRINLTGAFHCTQAVLPVMRRQKQGLIVYISSAAAKVADCSGVSYQASKRALVGLAHGTFEEEKHNGIRTSVLFPGFTDTPLALKRPSPPDAQTLTLALKPEDVAEACLFVASLPPRVHVPELVMLPAGLT